MELLIATPAASAHIGSQLYTQHVGLDEMGKLEISRIAAACIAFTASLSVGAQPIAPNLEGAIDRP